MLKKLSWMILVFSLTGCVGIPSESAIFEADEIENQNSGSVVRVIARGPEPGMNQIEIVQGFLDASASSENDFAIARSFLSPVAANNWLPSQSIQVYEGVGRLSSSEIDLINFTAPKEGEINSRFRYKLAASSDSLTQDFRLVQIEGEWRIRNAPRGLLISKADLNRSYRFYPLWFPDLSGQVLVPDPVVVPQAVSGTATLLVQLLLSGPSRELAAGVKTSFPQGVDLSLAAVTVENSVASVSLNSDALNTSSEQRLLMSGQITKTLTSIPGINAVRITVGSQALPIEGKPVQQTASDWQELVADNNRTQSATVAFNGRLFQIENSTVSTPFPAFLARQPVSYRAGVIDRAGAIYAALSSDASKVYVGNLASTQEPQLVLSGSSLNDPRIDRSGLIWVTSPEGVQVINGSEVRSVILQGLEADAEVFEVIPAPDGVRAAVIVNTISGRQLRLATIERDATSIRLIQFRAIENVWNNVTQVSWQTNNVLVLIDTTAELSTVASVDTLTGSTRIIDFVDDAISISASPVLSLLIGTADGSLLESIENEWQYLGNFQNPHYS